MLCYIKLLLLLTKFNRANLVSCAFSDYNFTENQNNLRSPVFRFLNVCLNHIKKVEEIGWRCLIILKKLGYIGWYWYWNIGWKGFIIWKLKLGDIHWGGSINIEIIFPAALCRVTRSNKLDWTYRVSLAIWENGKKK